MDKVSQVQILNEAICVSFRTNALVKKMYSSLLSSAIGKKNILSDVILVGKPV